MLHIVEWYAVFMVVIQSSSSSWISWIWK